MLRQSSIFAMRARLITLIASGAVVCLLAGCGTKTYDFKVNAMNSPVFSGQQSYRIVSGMPGVGESDPEFQEVAEHVRTALAGRGFYESPDTLRPDMIVAVSYGTESPRVEFRSKAMNPFPDPTTGITGPRGTGGGVWSGSGASVGVGGITVGKSSSPSSSSSTSDIEPVVVHEKFLKLSAQEQTEDYTGITRRTEIWNVEVRNEDDNPNFLEYVHLMAAAAVPYIGENSESQRMVRLKVDGTGEEIAYVEL